MSVISRIRSFEINKIPKKIFTSVKKLAGYKTFGLTYGAALATDQACKGVVNALLPEHPKISSKLITPQDLPTIVNLHHYSNPDVSQMLEFAGFIILPFFVVYTAAKKMNLKSDKLYQVGLALLSAGTAGNFISHLLLGYTTDFLHVPFTYYYTNLADMMAVVGVSLSIWRTIVNRKR